MVTKLTKIGAVVCGALVLAHPAFAQSTNSTDQENKYGVPAQTTSEPQEVFPIGTGAGSDNTQQRAYEQKLGASATWTFSDNLGRAQGGSEQNGHLLQFSPYYIGSLRTKRSWADIFAKFDHETAFPTSDGVIASSENGTGGRVTANGDFSLSGNLLRLDTGLFASRGSNLLSGFDPNAVGQPFFDRDQTLVRLSPYSRGDLGASHEYELRWETRYIDPTGRSANSTRNRLSGEVGSSAFARSGLGWGLRADVGGTRFADGARYDSTLSEFTIDYLFSDRLRMGVGANYLQADGILDANGKDSGVGPSVIWEWRPARSTRFVGRYAKAYFGNIASASLTRSVGSWAFRVAYNEGFEEKNAVGSFFFNPRDEFAVDRRDASAINRVARGLFERNLVIAPGTPLAPDIVDRINSPLIFDQTLTVAAGYLWKRSEMLATLFASQVEGAIPQASIGRERIRRIGSDVIFAYSVARRHRVKFKFGYRTTDEGAGTARTSETDFSLAWIYSLSRRLTSTLAYRRYQDDGTLGTNAATENAVFGVLDYRF